MKKLKIILVAVASVIILSNIAHAQITETGYPVKQKESLAVKYLGEEGEYLMFQVMVLGQIPDNAFLAVAENYEGVVYSTFFSPTIKAQIIKIEKKDDQVLKFKLVAGKNTYTKSVFVNTSLVDANNVAKLK